MSRRVTLLDVPPRHTVRVAVHVIVAREDGAIFFVRRARTGFMDGKLSLPSGHLEDGESVLEAAARETREEAGVIERPSDLEHVVTVHGRWRVAPYLHLFFRASRWEGTPHAAEPEKSSGCAWVHPGDDSADLIPYEREALEAPEGAVLVLDEARTT